MALQDHFTSTTSENLQALVHKHNYFYSKNKCENRRNPASVGVRGSLTTMISKTMVSAQHLWTSQIGISPEQNIAHNTVITNLPTTPRWVKNQAQIYHH